MKLYINTSDNQKTVVGLDNKRWSFPVKKQKSQQLLARVNQIMQKNKIAQSQLSAIEVNLGPGSFTGLKVGVAAANALGWALKIPINGRKVGQMVEPKYE